MSGLRHRLFDYKAQLPGLCPPRTTFCFLMPLKELESDRRNYCLRDLYFRSDNTIAFQPAVLLQCHGTIQERLVF